jgi:hypothetical protein
MSPSALMPVLAAAPAGAAQRPRGARSCARPAARAPGLAGSLGAPARAPAASSHHAVSLRASHAVSNGTKWSCMAAAQRKVVIAGAPASGKGTQARPARGAHPRRPA